MRLARLTVNEPTPLTQPIDTREGALPAPTNGMNKIRHRRGSTSASMAADSRSVYAVGVDPRNQAEVRRFAAAWPEGIRQEFAAGHEFLHAAPTLGTGCVLLLDPLADIETLAVVSWLGQQRPDLASIVIASAPTVGSAVACLKAGAADFLALPLEPATVSAAMHAVFEPQLERPNRSSALARMKLVSRVSQRELQVLEGLLAGLSNKAVGADLRISERTVEVHRSRIMRRLGVASFAELVRMSVRAGLDRD